MALRTKALGAALVLAAAPVAASGSAAPEPKLQYAFTAEVEVAPAIEQGTIDGGRLRFIPITGGKVHGPRLNGVVLPGGGDWQSILPGGLTKVEARYFLKADDGTVIQVTNPGVRVAAPEVIERLSRGEEVDPSLYYFRTTPVLKAAGEKNAWMERSAFVARGTRNPATVLIDFYVVE